MVSEDAHMQRLVRAHGVDVALSSSVLSALVDNHAPSYAEVWHLPIKIVQETDASGATVKTAYLDKPLLRQKLTPREKTELYYKIATESLILQPEAKGQQLNKGAGACL